HYPFRSSRPRPLGARRRQRRKTGHQRIGYLEARRENPGHREARQRAANLHPWRRRLRSRRVSKVIGMPGEKELLERIRQLEEQNNELQDKLDMIYSILAPDYEPEYEQGEGLVNIDGAS